MTVFITLIGGFGALFMGIKLLTAGAKEMVGHRFRRVLRHLTRSYPYAALFGLATGPLTLKTSVLFYTVTGMVSARALSLRRGADVIVWANIGGSPVMFLVAVDSRLLDMAVLGVAGAMYLFDLHRRERTRHLAQAALGAGLLILGINLMQEAAGLMKGTALLDASLQLATVSPLVAVAIGLAFGLVMPALVIAIVAVSLVAAGAMEFLTTGFLLVGGIVGNLSRTLVYMRRFERATQTLAYFNVVNQFAATVLVAGLLAVEQAGAGRPVTGITEWFAPHDLAAQCVILLVLWELASIGIALAFRDRGLMLAGRLVRVSKIDRLSTPRYLPAEPTSDSETAPILVEKEMIRLLPHLCAMIESVGTDPTRSPAHGPAVLHDANLALASRIETFIQEIQDRSQSRSFLIDGSLLKWRVRIAAELTGTVTAFVAAAGQAGRIRGLEASVEAMAESLHFLIDSTAEALESEDPQDLATAYTLTGDRTDLIQRTRERLVRDLTGLDRDGHQALFELSSRFERAVWLLHRLLPQPRPTGPASTLTASTA